MVEGLLLVQHRWKCAESRRDGVTLRLAARCVRQSIPHRCGGQHPSAAVCRSSVLGFFLAVF